jgi:hypothetical protein
MSLDIMSRCSGGFDLDKTLHDLVKDPPVVSKNLKDLFSKIFKTNPHDRINFDDLWQHPALNPE